MKKIFPVFLLVFLTCSIATAENIRVITYNIRYDNPDDGENSWKLRKQHLINLLFRQDASVIGFQEVLKNQLHDLDEALTEYDRVGVARDGKKGSGEYCAIYFKKELFEHISDGTFWLSRTPCRPSKGWDAALRRICTWVQLKDKRSGDIFFVFNTHLDHRGKKARLKSASLILKKIKIIAGDNPVIFCGDLNASPEEPPIEIIRKTLLDSKEVSVATPKGPSGTWNAFDPSSPLDRRIDYVFVSRHFQVFNYIVDDAKPSGNFPSDHLPVIIEVGIARKPDIQPKYD